MVITQTSQLLITRDGSIDWEITNQQIAQERSEALKSAGRELLYLTAEKSLQALKWGAAGLLNVTEQLVEAAN